MPLPQPPKKKLPGDMEPEEPEALDKPKSKKKPPTFETGGNGGGMKKPPAFASAGSGASAAPAGAPPPYRGGMPPAGPPPKATPLPVPTSGDMGGAPPMEEEMDMGGPPMGEEGMEGGYGGDENFGQKLADDVDAVMAAHGMEESQGRALAAHLFGAIAQCFDRASGSGEEAGGEEMMAEETGEVPEEGEYAG